MFIFNPPPCNPNAPNRDVHTEHCCAIHGCKYGDDDCTVMHGKQVQSWWCEDCDYANDEAEEELKELQAMPVEHIQKMIDTLQEILKNRL